MPGPLVLPSSSGQANEQRARACLQRLAAQLLGQVLIQQAHQVCMGSRQGRKTTGGAFEGQAVPQAANQHAMQG